MTPTRRFSHTLSGTVGRTDGRGEVSNAINHRRRRWWRRRSHRRLGRFFAPPPPNTHAHTRRTAPTTRPRRRFSITVVGFKRGKLIAIGAPSLPAHMIYHKILLGCCTRHRRWCVTSVNDNRVWPARPSKTVLYVWAWHVCVSFSGGRDGGNVTTDGLISATAYDI